MDCVDERFIIKVADLMETDSLPYPRKKRKISILVNYGEWLPIIDGSTGKCFP